MCGAKMEVSDYPISIMDTKNPNPKKSLAVLWTRTRWNMEYPPLPPDDPPPLPPQPPPPLPQPEPEPEVKAKPPAAKLKSTDITLADMVAHLRVLVGAGVDDDDNDDSGDGTPVRVHVHEQAAEVCIDRLVGTPRLLREEQSLFAAKLGADAEHLSLSLRDSANANGLFTRHLQDNRELRLAACRLVCQYAPKSAAAGIVHGSDVELGEVMRSFFFGRPDRERAWFDNFYVEASLYGSRALERWVYRNRLDHWNVLQWKDQKAHPPFMVAQNRARHFPSLHVVETVERLLDVDEFWVSDEWKSELLNGAFIALDPDYFAEFMCKVLARELQGQGQGRGHPQSKSDSEAPRRMIMPMDAAIHQYLASEQTKFSSLCPRLLFHLTPEQLVEFANEFVALQSSSATAPSTVATFATVLRAGAPWSLAEAMLVRCAAVSRRGDVIKCLVEAEACEGGGDGDGVWVEDVLQYQRQCRRQSMDWDVWDSVLLEWLIRACIGIGIGAAIEDAALEDAAFEKLWPLVSVIEGLGSDKKQKRMSKSRDTGKSKGKRKRKRNEVVIGGVLYNTPATCVTAMVDAIVIL